MKNSAFALLFVVPAALFVWMAYLIFSAPTVDWNGTDAQIQATIAVRHHMYLQAAYLITWAIQLSYLAWLGLKWNAQKSAAEHAGITGQSLTR